MDSELLHTRGFFMAGGAIATERVGRLAEAYDRAVADAATGDIREWHVDVARNSADWPLVSFIVMIDEFRADNGATRFVPGSHFWPRTPADVMVDGRNTQTRYWRADWRAQC